MRTTDNNCGKSLFDCRYNEQQHCIDDLTAIANYDLHTKKSDSNDLLIFPESLDFDDSHIFTLKDNTIKTGNLMGFVGRNDTQLTIFSRFYSAGNDFFLHYMLQKVFSINLLNLKVGSNNENIWDFLLYLFPHFLKKAYSQGLYKAYKQTEYNDANVKGAIDIKRQIRINIPFCGKIAYTTREHSHDNPVTQLVRHTIEHIKTHPFSSGILTNDPVTRDIVSKFCFVTQNSYNKNARQKVISANRKPVSHPYFTEYKMLQKLCLQILRYEKLTFGTEKDKIYGLLFDGAWLWEEYLNTFIGSNFRHLHNKKGEGYQLFETGEGKICPDFMDEKNKIIADAKYKPVENIKGDDYLQILAYMFRFNSKNGFFIYPSSANNDKKAMKLKDNNDVYVYKISFHIPQNVDNFIDFQSGMRENEQLLRLEKMYCY